MKRVVFISLFLSLLLIFNNCNSVPREKSNRVEQRLIFPQYTVSYDAESESLTASAQFNLNNSVGNFIQLSSKSNILFNEKKLKFIVDKENKKVYYSLKLNEKIPKKLIFEYTNDENSKFLNRIHVNSLDLKEESYTINKQSNFTLSYHGEKFSNDETLECFIEKNKTVVASFFPEIKTNSELLIISSSNISALPDGDYFFYFIRRKSSTEINAMDRGGYWETEYISKKIKLNIK